MVKRSNIIKAKKTQQINQREIRLINDRIVDGLLLIDIKPKGSSMVLTYNVEGLMGLKDFLSFNGISKKTFAVILRNIVVTLRGVENNKLNRDLIVWNSDALYIEPSSLRVYLMYVPLQPYEAEGNLKTLLQQLVSACNFSLSDNAQYVQDLVREMNSVTAYTVGMLEAYCDKLSSELLGQKQKNSHQDICSACGQKLAVDDAVCPFCGKRIASKPQVVSRKTEYEKNSSFWDAEQEARTNNLGCPSKTVSIGKNENGVVTVFGSSNRMIQSVCLEECSTAKKIYISKFPFRIGKAGDAKDVELFNNAISRKHADILKEHGQYYITDLDSTNGTYINGKKIQPGVKELLTDGMLVRFANTEFKFCVTNEEE